MNRAELAAQFGWDSPRERSCSDADYVVAAYQRWGAECPARLEGDFSFVLWDPAGGLVLGVRDRVGVRPLYYRSEGDELCLATSIPPLLGGRSGVGVRTEWLARYVVGLSASAEDTAYEGVRKLRPGTALVSRADALSVAGYHDFVDDAPWANRRDPEWLVAYRKALDAAVSARIPTPGLIGVESSGGLDSSTLVALIAGLHTGPVDDIHTFGHIVHQRDAELVLRTSQKYRIPNNHIGCGPGSDTDVSAPTEVLGHPPEHAMTGFHLDFYRLGRTLGVTSLHSGHGGDEVVTSKAALVPFELVRRRSWRRMATDLPLVHPIRLAGRYRAHPRRGARAIVAGGSARIAASLLRRDAVEEFHLYERNQSRSPWPRHYDTLNEWIIEERCGSGLSTRTAEASQVAAAFGIEYQWPLLDARLIQQYLSTPSVWKYGKSLGRYLHRCAVADELPPEIVWAPTKDTGSSTWLPGPPDYATEVRERRDALLGGDLHPQLGEIVDLGTPYEQLMRSPRMATFGLRRVHALNDWLLART